MTNRWTCRSVKTFLSSVSIFFVLALTSHSAMAQILAYPHVYEAFPSHSKAKGKEEKFISKYMCVGRHDGKSYPCSIESRLLGIRDSEGVAVFEISNMIQNIPDLNSCPNTSGLDVEELFIYGGHVGDKNSGGFAGSFTFGNTNYELDGSAAGDGRYYVEGETKTNVASQLVYVTTRRSGIYSALTTLTVPESPSPSFVWRFSDGFSINNHIDRHIIGIKGLARLPGCPDGAAISGQNYTLIRTGADILNHPEGHWGLQETHKVARDLADKAFKSYNRKISYNDLSLPLGGYSHHDTHRSGKDIDLNPSAMRYDCTAQDNKDKFIKWAFVALYGFDHLVKGKDSSSPNDKNYPNLHCYSDKRMHIDAVSGF